eukprot:Nk52_evm5s322 gene=Nk52_evmTU5s322
MDGGSSCGAALWTDGRYHVSAAKQIDSNWALMKEGIAGTPSVCEWIHDRLINNNAKGKEDEETPRKRRKSSSGSFKNEEQDEDFMFVGVDAFTIDSVKFDLYEKEFEKLSSSVGKRIKLVALTKGHLVDLVWLSSSSTSGEKDVRPPFPKEPVTFLSESYTGRNVHSKLRDLDTRLVEGLGCDGMIITALDQIAWLLNLRGSDIPYNPVFFAYCVYFAKGKGWPGSSSKRRYMRLYIDEAKFNAQARAHIDGLGAKCDNMDFCVRPYGEILEDLKLLVKAGEKRDGTGGCTGKVLVSGCSKAIAATIADGIERVNKKSKNGNVMDMKNVTLSPISEAKAVKNATEIRGMRNCHVKDAAAVCSHLYWLEQTLVVAGRTNISEYDGVLQLGKCRAEQKEYVSDSFKTILATGGNAAIIHYKPDETQSSIIDADQIYLVDSGGQYLDGTTDITRTVHLKMPTEFEKEAFTRVLMGYLDICMCVFRKGTTGRLLDILARKPLWEAGLDFGHGVGHGVGAYLNVHEFPPRISGKASADEMALEPGMIMSNEPGFYETDSFGIRIESLIVVQKACRIVSEKGVYDEKDQISKQVLPPVAKSKSFSDEFYCFDELTFVPFQRKMIVTSMMTKEQIAYVNNYHKRCLKLTGDLLKSQGKTKVYEWLERECRPL